MPGKSAEREAAELRKSFFDEGLLNEFWEQIESLEDDENNPNFIEETTVIFFSQIEGDISSVTELLESDPVEFPRVAYRISRMIGSSSSIGMATINTKVKQFENFCAQKNLEGMKGSLNELKEELVTVKGKIQHYFELLKQARRAK